MLMKLRPLILQKEPTEFTKLRNCIWKATESKRLRKHLDTLLYLYTGRRLQSVFVFGASSPEYPQGAVVNSEFMLDCWLNGCRFHKDKEKQKILDAMHGIMPAESSVALLLFLITDKIVAILALQRLVSLLAGRQKEIFTQIILEEPIRYIAYLHPTMSMINFLDREPDEEPLEGPWDRRFDITQAGPITLTQFVDIVGRFWMNGEFIKEIGEYHYCLRVAKGSFPDKEGKRSENETDAIATIQVQAFLVEDPLSYARRKPEKALQERMTAASKGESSRKMFMRMIDSQAELEKVLDRDPKPEMESIVVPRVAFMGAYWPLSKQANVRFTKIMQEGRQPTFEEIEGTDITAAWEIFEEPRNEQEQEREGPITPHEYHEE